VQERSIDRIRNATFSHAVRGYDRQEVDGFLRELADWLEEGGESEAASETIRAELERIGEQTASILSEAHDAGEALRANAAGEARQKLIDANATAETVRSDANEQAERVREDADAYSLKTRTEADEYAQRVRGDADAYAAELRAEVESEAEEKRAEANRDAERTAAEANRRKADIDSLISDLEQRRDAVLAELERLASGITGAASQHRTSPANGDEAAEASDEAQSKAQAQRSE
jgi:DivIVA domain-containing protein